MTREVTAVLGAGGLTDADVVLELGSQHPSTHGGLRLALVLDGDVVVAAEPVIGYMHRGAEKLFEVRDYRQVTVLANRHDWLAAFSNELGVVMAVERLMGMEVPPRAVWLRTLLAELNRVLSHLAFLGAYPLELGQTGPMTTATRAREVVQALLEEATGGRMHYMANRVGGLREDVPAGWTDRARMVVAAVRDVLPDLERLVHEDPDFGAATRGVGVLDTATAASYGVSGPVARASGLDLDLRRDDPYLAYGELDVTVVLGTAGDCWERFRCLLDQVRVSLELADACLDRLPTGAVGVKLPKTVRAPEGTTYVWTENPSGLMGWYLVSRGDRAPWRLAMRTASFGNVSVVPALLPGTQVRDLVTVLASLFFVVGDLDK